MKYDRITFIPWNINFTLKKYIKAVTFYETLQKYIEFLNTVPYNHYINNSLKILENDMIDMIDFEVSLNSKDDLSNILYDVLFDVCNNGNKDIIIDGQYKRYIL